MITWRKRNRDLPHDAALKRCGLPPKFVMVAHTGGAWRLAEGGLVQVIAAA